MKKIITILTCLCLILTLGACSTKKEEEVVTVEKTVKTVDIVPLPGSDLTLIYPPLPSTISLIPPVLKPMALQATLWP